MAGLTRVESRVSYTAVAVEQSLGELAPNPAYQVLDLTSYSDASTQSDTTTRSVMAQGRRLKKGAVTGRSTTFGYNIDNTIGNTIQQVCAFLFNEPREKVNTRPILTRSVGGIVVLSRTANTIKLSAPPTALATGMLVILEDGMNDRKLLEVVEITGNDVKVSPRNGGLPLNTTLPPRKFSRIIQVAVKLPTGAKLTATATSATLNVGSAPTIAGLGLSVGEWVYFGDTRVSGTPPTFTPFFARISKIAGTDITFDTTTTPVSLTEQNMANQLLFVGTFIKDGDTTISMNHTRYLGDNNDKAMVQEFFGCVANEMAINSTERTLMTMDFGYMCLDSTTKEEASADYIARVVNNMQSSYEQEPINLSTDVVRQRMYIPNVETMNTAAIHSFVQELTVNISNGLTEDTAMGTAAAIGMTAGDFTVTGSLTAYFNGIEALRAIECNCTVGIDMIYARKNSGLVIDIPALTLATNGLTLEKGQAIKIPLDQAAFESRFDSTMSYTVFHYLPDAAMPHDACDC